MQALFSRFTGIFSRGTIDMFHLWAFWRFYWSRPGYIPQYSDKFLNIGRLYFLKQPDGAWRRGRFTDDDIVIGPLTVAKTSSDSVRLILRGSCDEDNRPSCTLTGYAFGFGFRLFLPKFVKPVLEKVHAQGWDAATIERMGRDWYPNYHSREYGFSCHDGHLSFYYGMQNRNGWGGKLINRRKSWFLPWTQWTHVRHSYYDLQGKVFYEEGKRTVGERIDGYVVRQGCPAAYFLIRDYDGKKIVARTIHEEREWHKGEKSFAWLKYFTKPLIRTVLEISFAEEVGTGKGSWKGGLCGTSIDMLPGETHQDAFVRYCHKEYNQKEGRYKIEFIRPVHVDELILLVPPKCSW